MICSLKLGCAQHLEARERTAALGAGPRAALKRLDLGKLPLSERKKWVEDARLDAILGRSQASTRSLRSGISCFVSFVGERAFCRLTLVCSLLFRSLFADSVAPGTKRYFPPSLDTLLAWSVLFRSAETYSNYLSYVKTACVLARESVAVGASTLAPRVCSSFALGMVERCLNTQP